MADKVFNADDGALLTELIRRWAASEPYNAIAWMQDKGDLPEQLIGVVAQELTTRTSIRETLSHASLLSSQHRSNWIRGAATAGGAFDAAETISALRRFEGEPFYDHAMLGALMTTISSEGPRRAADLAGTAPPPLAAAMIGMRWANESPDEAAAWALSLSDPLVRASAVESVARAWADRDPDRASIWIDGLADTTLREQLRARFLP